MVLRRFDKPFIRQEPIPEDGISAAVDVMRSGALHRYGWPKGESPAEVLEQRFADWQGTKYCLAVTSGGQAMRIALQALGVKSGEPVLTNAWTLAPVPGAIAAVGATPILVETTENLVIDLADLKAKAIASNAKVLLLSHMRGHLADMDALMKWADSAGVTVIEDCAHTMGAQWRDKRSGNFGQIGCFSTQTYKHLNSGEGGFLTTNDPEIAAQATILSGSYMLWARHGAGPDADAYDDARLDMPNGSARMDNLRAAILLPQLQTLEDNLVRWERRAEIVGHTLSSVVGVVLPQAPEAVRRIGSSIQWRMRGLDADGCRAFVASCQERGVEVKWFGDRNPVGFTSAHQSWRYVHPQDLPKTDAVLANLFDMRLPLSFTEEDCAVLADILVEVAEGALATKTMEPA